MDEQELAVFNIISLAGDSRTLAFEALRLARQGDFDQADAKLEAARKASVEVHKLQTEMITKEAQGEHQNVSLLMVHAQDHLMTSLLARDLITEMIGMLKEQNLQGSLD
ncbi:PTS lactose/cellobiose transporter subunit IIA [Lacticaseibacillus daqingensis]|uniref:PTS lactose/cellobiose transporter subunit IIA n=1 Tax=Lacticaseibacillus daqingensis TaxID=2486014 RepID=UPI000F79289D|nr:PTS lactose/cellobiose transporter subunit IIA [Lacticaseibacillus daqingensis]